MIPLSEIPSFPPHVDEPSVVFGTTDCLPQYDDLPEAYRKRNAPGCKIASAIFFEGWSKALAVVSEVYEGTELNLETPPEDYEYGSEERDPVKRFQRAIAAHLRSWEPKHEHKEAGVGYLIDLWTNNLKE